MVDKLSRCVARHPWPFVILFVVTALLFASQLPRAQVDPEVKNQIPKTFPARANLDRIEATFGGVDMLMVTLVADDVLAPKTLERIKRISDAMVKLDQVDRVLSLFELKDIKNEGETMIVDPAVKTIPRTAKQREALREDLKKNDLIFGSVVSEDFKATAVIGLLKVEFKDDEVNGAVNRIIADNPGPEQVHRAGMPIIRDQVGKGIRGDLRTFLPVGMLVMLIFLFISFRQLRGVLLPFFVVAMSIGFSMGLIPLLGWKIQMLIIILPVILLAIANDYGIHLVARYQEVNTPGNTLTPGDLGQTVLFELFKPIGIAGLTTMAGLMCLLMHIIVPAKQLGLLATAGILYALLASLLFVPAMLAILRKAKPVVTAAAGTGRMSLLDRVLSVTARKVSANPKKIIVGFVAVSGLVAIGISRLEIDTNAINYFPEDHPLAVSSRVADRYFGGSVTFSVIIAGDIKHPAVLRRLDDLEQRVKELPYVDQTSSIAKVVRQMNKVMNNDDPTYDAIPDTRDGVAQLLLMYENSGEPDDFDRLVDFDYRNALLTGRINTASTKQQSQVIKFVREYVKQTSSHDGATPVMKVKQVKLDTAARPDQGIAADTGSEGGARREAEPEPDSPFTMAGDEEGTEAKQPGKVRGQARAAAASTHSPSRFTLIGGFGVLFNDLVDAVVTGQLSSLSLSLVLVVIIVAILFRSVMAGLYSGGTLALAMAFLFGLMGLLNIEINMPTAMLSSIMIGVGVDYTIHFLWRYRSERRAGRDYTEAVIRTLTTSGRGIIINALSVIVGFAVMLLSSFAPARYFGFLVVVSIGACLLGAMVLMPALVLIFKPRFLEPVAEVNGS
jgi:predicted RND superfamily exporter protein